MAVKTKKPKAVQVTIVECDKQIVACLYMLNHSFGQREICWNSIDYWLDERLELMHKNP